MATDTEDRRATSLSGPDGRPPAGEPPPRESAGLARVAALAALTAALAALCVALAVPVLPALTWGAALAVIAWPLHARLARWIGRPTLAALVSTAAVVALILVPVLFVALQVSHESAAAAEHLRDAEGGLR